jgi:hypothetical protein
MGREADGQARFRGQEGAVRALLETDALILRGALRARLSRAGLAGWRLDGDDLVLTASGEPLVLTLGAKEAAAWLRALDKPLPSLAQKLGVSAAAKAWVIGDALPEPLAEALLGARAEGPQEAAWIVAVLTEPAEIAAAVSAARQRALPLWCVHGKGKGAVVGDAAVRAAFRGAGWMDIKSCAVSETFTATLYRPPVGAG